MATVQKPNAPNPDQRGPFSAETAPYAPPSPGTRDSKIMPWSWICLALVLATALLYGSRLGALDFWAPDEPRYGAIAEEIRSFRHGARGLVLLHLNETPYTQKPPLYFWLAALAGIPTGHVSEWAARLPSAIAGVGAVLLTAVTTRTLLRSPSLAWLAAGILATSFRFVFTARRAQLDVLLTLFELIAVAVFVHLEFKKQAFRPGSEVPKSGVAIMHGALGLGALVKGPVAWLPLAIFAAYLAAEGRGREFRKIAPLWAWSLSLAPVCVWILSAIALAPDGFAQTAVGENLLGRFFSGTSHARPPHYFLFQTPVDFMPWTLLLPWAFGPVRKALSQIPKPDFDSQRSATRFVVLWFFLPLLFFSLSAGKRGVYLLPFFPALSIFAALAAARLIGEGGIRQRRMWGLRTLLAVAAIELAVATLVLPLPRLAAEKSPRPIAEAAAARSQPDRAIGLFGLDAFAGPIGYYGKRRAVFLRSEAELRTHFEAPGSLVILRERDFDAFRERLDLVRVESFRSGSRTLILATILH